MKWLIALIAGAALGAGHYYLLGADFIQTGIEFIGITLFARWIISDKRRAFVRKLHRR